MRVHAVCRPKASHQTVLHIVHFLEFYIVLTGVCSDGRIVAMEFYKMERGDDGEYRVDEDQFIRVKCDFVISAFGSEVGSLTAVQK